MKKLLTFFFILTGLLSWLNQTACTIIVAGKKATTDGSVRSEEHTSELQSH